MNFKPFLSIQHILEGWGLGEPSAVDRLAALGDPDGPVAKRVAVWEMMKENEGMFEALDASNRHTHVGPDRRTIPPPQIMHVVPMYGEGVLC